MKVPQPWKPGDATRVIRDLAHCEKFQFTLTEHFKRQLFERDLTMTDVIHVLRNGFVYREAQMSTRPPLCRYRMDSKSRNSGARTIRVVVIPDAERTWIKVVTVMWVDEDR